MSINVAELLVKAKSSEKSTGAAPDPQTDPEGALRHHRSLWPLNQKVADGDLPEKPEGSDRVRLRRAAEELTGCGVIMNGSFAQTHRQNGNLSMMAGFSGSGDLWSSHAKIVLDDSGTMEPEEMLALTQKILQHWGFAAVVAINNSIILAKAGSESAAQWAETDLSPRYGGSRPSKVTPAQMLQYDRTLTGLRVYGVEDWAASSFTPEQAKDWCEKKVTSPREAEMWVSLGLDSTKAREWLDARVSVSQAGGWLGEGYTPAKAAPWAAVTADFSQAKAWIDAGYKPAGAEMWIRFCGRSVRNVTPDDVRLLIDGKVGAKQLARLSEAGCDGQIIAPLGKWVGRYKIELDEALQWAELGPEFIGPGKRGRWHKAGFTPKEIKVWQKALGRRAITLDQVQGKIAAGFDPSKGAEWTVVSPRFSDASLVSSWTEAGLTPDDARPWVALSESFCHFGIVEGWTQAGLGVKDAEKWVKENPNFVRYSRVKEWEDTDPRLVGKPELAAELERMTRPDMVSRILETMKRAED